MAAKLVKKIVLTYTLEDDPEQVEQTMTVTHTGKGQVVDGMVWGEALMDKLYYEDAGTREHRPVGRRPGSESPVEAWSVESGGEKVMMTRSNGRDCVWLHEPNCFWWEFCGG